MSGMRNHPRLGQLFFSVMSHSLYDFFLYRFVTPMIWRCSTERLTDLYVENVSDNHLEVGVGSGYFLERTLCADFVRRLELLDLNQRCLEKSAKRLRAYSPKIRHGNILDADHCEERQFSSVGMNYVLHCIPGSFQSNRRIFKHIAARLREGGVFFGATLIKQPPQQGIGSWLFMRLLNLADIFHNHEHSEDQLRSALEAYFSKVHIKRAGNAALFKAVK